MKRKTEAEGINRQGVYTNKCKACSRCNVYGSRNFKVIWSSRFNLDRKAQVQLKQSHLTMA